jgi:hypothetical protein
MSEPLSMRTWLVCPAKVCVYIGPGPKGLLHGGHADDVPLVGNFGN